MHPYQQWKEKMEKDYNQSIKELIFHFYITQDEGPSVTARELGIPRKAVIHFINEFNLRPIKHKQIKQGSMLEQAN